MPFGPPTGGGLAIVISRSSTGATVARRVDHAHDQVVRAVAHARRVERHVHALARLARPHVEERRSPVARPPDVRGSARRFRPAPSSAPPARRSRTPPRTRPTPDRSRRTPTSLVPRTERRAREFAGDVRRGRAHGLFEDDVCRVQVHGRGVAVRVAFAFWTFISRDAVAKDISVQCMNQRAWIESDSCDFRQTAVRTDYPRVEVLQRMTAVKGFVFSQPCEPELISGTCGASPPSVSPERHSVARDNLLPPVR